MMGGPQWRPIPLNSPEKLWYAEHNFTDFIKLITKWYEDAAAGNLIKINGEDFFEPFRTMKSDTVIFKVPYEDPSYEAFI